jgi:hypothetical protein
MPNHSRQKSILTEFPTAGKTRPAKLKPNPQFPSFYHFSAVLSITVWQNFRTERVLAASINKNLF